MEDIEMPSIYNYYNFTLKQLDPNGFILNCE